MNKIERIAFFSLAILVWVYLGFRSYYIPLIHDETVTYFVYIQDGNFIPPWAYWDANNHLLNSAIGAFFHWFLGHSPFIARLGSWLSFIPLVIFIYGISDFIKDKISKWAFIIPLLTTPFFIEFFSLTRGYGMAMSWFLGLLFFSMRFTKTPSTKYFVGVAVTGLLASLSSLSVIVAVLIVYGWLWLNQLVNNRNSVISFSLKWLGAFILPQIPLVYYVFQLKNRGLLYYGGDEVIKYSLEPFARYYFNNRELWWIAAIVITALFLYYSIDFLRSKFRNLFEPKHLIPIVLILSVVSVFAQHFILGVNYPEDRAMLYFFPLLVFSLATITSKKWVKIALVVPLIWFPLDLVKSANMENSKLWPNEHVPTRFWNQVNELKEEYPVSFSAYFLRNGIWNFHSLDNGYSSSPNSADFPSKWADVIMVDSMRINQVNLSNYKHLDFDSISGQTLLQRFPLLEEVLVKDTTFTELLVQNEFTNIFEFDGATWGQEPMALYFDFDPIMSSDIVHLNLITTLFDTTGAEIFTAQYDFSLVSEQWKSENIWRIKQFLPPFPLNAGRFVSYVYNSKHENHILERFTGKLVRLIEPEKN